MIPEAECFHAGTDEDYPVCPTCGQCPVVFGQSGSRRDLVGIAFLVYVSSMMLAIAMVVVMQSIGMRTTSWEAVVIGGAFSVSGCALVSMFYNRT